MKNMRLDAIFQGCFICFIPMSGIEKIMKIRLLPVVIRRTVFETALKPQGISKSVQHVEVAPNP